MHNDVGSGHGQRLSFLAGKGQGSRVEEGANVMLMIGCDFHPGLEELALLDTETGQRRQQRLSHAFGLEPVRQFYAGLPRPARVGL
ncbi:hypothetical protein [Edaphobacter aggregans]|uniref:hypothetical protein n=1 Tax=Edaphobacter aggregans TaxID=570835 RepID=UPI0012F8997A|nr:hypothetical protein [Edaphobacter aggregans]